VELTVLAAGYGSYAAIRNTRASTGNDPHALSRAVANARGVVAVERFFDLHVEASIQRWFLNIPDVVRGANVLYATAHILVTAAVIVALWFAQPDRYRRMRTALLLSTAIALAVFALLPTAPPRLLPAGVGAQDTLATMGGLWSFRTPIIEHISDPLAAMPSLHLAWAVWSSAAVAPLVRSRFWRRAALAYPAVVGLVVVITGNHWLLDVVAGVLVGLAGLALAGHGQAMGAGSGSADTSVSRLVARVRAT
jgi:membrane-associated phospholipid phosphatase